MFDEFLNILLKRPSRAVLEKKLFYICFLKIHREALGTVKFSCSMGRNSGGLPVKFGSTGSVDIKVS